MILLNYRCPYCFCIISSKKNRAETHLRNIHNDVSLTKKTLPVYKDVDGDVVCPLCAEHLFSENLLNSHFYKRHITQENKLLKKNKKKAISITPSEKLYCPYCFTSLTQQIYFTHINSIHHKKALERQPIKFSNTTSSAGCPCCTSRFPSIETLKEHYKKYHSEDLKLHQDEKKVVAVKKPTVHSVQSSGSIIEKQLEAAKKYTEKLNIKNEKIPIKISTDRIYVLELLKTNVYISQSKYFSRNALKELLKEKNHVDSVNTIDKDLLVQLCKELYEEYSAMWYVTGSNNTLQLCKASSIVEWRKMQAYSNIYIPNISINGKLYSFDEITLYVYDSISKLVCPNSLNHKVENVTIITKNMYGEDTKFNAFHCLSCNKYYTNIEAVKDQFALNNYPLIKLDYLQMGDFMRKESELTIYGYNARKDGMPEYERQNLISSLLHYNVLTKEQVMNILKTNISMHSKLTNHDEAVQKWKTDLDFVMNLHLDNQTKVVTGTVNSIYKGRKQ